LPNVTAIFDELFCLYTGAKAVVISEKSKTAELTTGSERIADDLVAALHEVARDSSQTFRLWPDMRLLVAYETDKTNAAAQLSEKGRRKQEPRPRYQPLGGRKQTP
jgi:hypothetical protein